MTSDPTRRTVLAAFALAGAAVTTGPRPALAEPAAPDIHPRSDWAGSLQPTGGLEKEAAGDVKFLLVHHSETGNGYAADKVPSLLRGMYTFHTGPEKKWPDLAYNFLIDAYGGIWEGRAGSLAGPVKGSATGGSQGFAQLCCFIGTHTDSAPTAAAQAAMSATLAWLAQRYSVDLRAGKTITFTSRGSNKWPAGRTVTTDPVAGHRDMSETSCPGDACYPLVRGSLLSGAIALLPAAATPAPAPAAPTPEPTTAPPTTPEATATATAEPSETATASTSASPTATQSVVEAAETDSGGPSTTVIAAGVGAAAAVAAGAVAAVISGRRAGDVPDLSDDEPSRLDD